jgi:quinolinate synthase
MNYELPEVTVPEDIRLKAKSAIDRMLDISAKAGL